MITRFSRGANRSSSDRRSGFPFSSWGDSRGSGPKRGKQVDDLKRTWGRTAVLVAVFACLPAALVASWLQIRLVKGLEARLTTGEVRDLAARMDSVVAARVSVLRMAGGSLETEHLSASGGLNRLLSGLKELFPDFRSLEIFNEYGQPLAMMGELSLSEVGKKAGLSRSTTQESPSILEPVFQDAPVDDCFFLTLRHQGTDAGLWFSRARFSREAIASLLAPHKGDRHVSLVSVPVSGEMEGNPSTGPRSMARAHESLTKGASSWRTRSYMAVAPLETPGWIVTVERTFPASMGSYLSTVICMVLVLLSGILFFRKRATAEGVPAVPATQETNPVFEAQREEVPRVPSPPDEPPLPGEVSTEENPAEVPASDQRVEQSDEFGTAVALSSWHAAEETEAAPHAPAPCEEIVDSPADLAAVCHTDEFTQRPDGEMRVWEAETDTFPAMREPACPGDPIPASEESVAFVDDGEDESVIVGAPILQNAIPDTLEVSWIEPLPEENDPPREQSGVKIVGSWY